jgi:hypothetical protein
MRLKKIAQLQTMAAAAGSFSQRIEQFVAQAMLLAADGLSLAEIGQLFQALVQLAVEGAAELAQSTGEQKKAMVLEAVGYLYDRIAPAIPLPWFLQLFRAFLRVPIRNLVLALASGAIEAVVARLPSDETVLADV